MKRRYVTTTILMASKTKRRKNIHEQLEETLAERRRIMREWETIKLAPEAMQPDIHAQLEETIAGLKKVRKHTATLLYNQARENFPGGDKKAA